MSETKLTRPKAMGMSDFQELAAEITERVGVDNVELLKDIDMAMNTEEPMSYYLDIPYAKAKDLAASSGVDEKRFFAYLAFLYEIEYRKAHGPKMWERKRGVVPCPDYLSPTKWQIRRKHMPFYNICTKIWNVSLIIVFAGAFPFMLGPLSNFITSKGQYDYNNLTIFNYYSIIAFCGWIFFLFLCLTAFSLSRYFRNKR